MNTETQLRELATRLIEQNVTPSWLDWYVLYTRQTTAFDWKADFDDIVHQSDESRQKLARDLRTAFRKYKRQKELTE